MNWYNFFNFFAMMIKTMFLYYKNVSTLGEAKSQSTYAIPKVTFFPQRSIYFHSDTSKNSYRTSVWIVNASAKIEMVINTISTTHTTVYLLVDKSDGKISVNCKWRILYTITGYTIYSSIRPPRTKNNSCK